MAELAEEWELRLGRPFADVHASLAMPVERADGEAAVLKINFAEPETEHEGGALRWWAGEGAVRLLAEDPARAALLVERCVPGTQLWAVEEDDALAAAAGVLRRLRRPSPASHPFRLLADEAERWQAELPARWERLGRPFERALLDHALGALAELGRSQPDSVVVHQDLHGGNVLRSSRGGWLAIDPKPLVGDPAFDAASLLRDRREWLAEEPQPVARIARRLDVLADELLLERERLRGWGIAHALAWGVEDDGVHELHVACARWLAEAR